MNQLSAGRGMRARRVIWPDRMKMTPRHAADDLITILAFEKGASRPIEAKRDRGWY